MKRPAFFLLAALGLVSALLGSRTGWAAADFTVTSTSMSAYTINGQGNPTLTLLRGHSYTFDVNALGHPFWIKTTQETGSDGAFDQGVTNNGTSLGSLLFTVPANAPASLYYQCQYHEPMTGLLTISAAAAAVPATTTSTRLLLVVALGILGVAVLSNLRRFPARRSRAAGQIADAGDVGR